jgi:hypothetical protein
MKDPPVRGFVGYRRLPENRLNELSTVAQPEFLFRWMVSVSFVRAGISEKEDNTGLFGDSLIRPAAGG